MTLLLKELVGSDGAETLCSGHRQAVEQYFDRNNVFVDLAEVYCKLVRPSFSGVFLVVDFVVVTLAQVFGCRDLERESSETDGESRLRQVGAVLNTPNRVLALSALRRRPAAAASVSAFALLSYVFGPYKTTLSGRRRRLLNFRHVVVGTHAKQ